MLADHEVGWLEELSPDDLEGYRRLTERSRVRIAGVEVFCRPQELLPWIDGDTFDCVQPDLTRADGISECRQIATHAIDRGVRFVPHDWNTAVGLAADLQLLASLHRADWVEYVTPSPFIDDLVTEALDLNDTGALTIAEGPGLGLTWNLDGIARHTTGR